MPSFTTIVTILALGASIAVAAPTSTQTQQCLQNNDARQVAQNFADLLQEYSDDLAINALTEDFHDYSSSVNTLINTCPESGAKQVDLNAATFSSRVEFMEGQKAQPPIHFKILKQWNDCNTVTIRWMSDNTAPIANPRPVYGVAALETVPAQGGNFPHQIKTAYSEFNSGAWVENLQDAGQCPKASINGDHGGTDGSDCEGSQGGGSSGSGNHNQGQQYGGPDQGEADSSPE